MRGIRIEPVTVTSLAGKLIGGPDARDDSWLARLSRLDRYSLSSDLRVGRRRKSSVNVD